MIVDEVFSDLDKKDTLLFAIAFNTSSPPTAELPLKEEAYYHCFLT